MLVNIANYSHSVFIVHLWTHPYKRGRRDLVKGALAYWWLWHMLLKRGSCRLGQSEAVIMCGFCLPFFSLFLTGFKEFSILGRKYWSPSDEVGWLGWGRCRFRPRQKSNIPPLPSGSSNSWANYVPCPTGGQCKEKDCCVCRLIPFWELVLEGLPASLNEIPNFPVAHMGSSIGGWLLLLLSGLLDSEGLIFPPYLSKLKQVGPSAPSVPR